MGSLRFGRGSGVVIRQVYLRARRCSTGNPRPERGESPEGSGQERVPDFAGSSDSKCRLPGSADIRPARSCPPTPARTRCPGGRWSRLVRVHDLSFVRNQECVPAKSRKYFFGRWLYIPKITGKYKSSMDSGLPASGYWAILGRLKKGENGIEKGRDDSAFHFHEVRDDRPTDIPGHDLH